MMTTHLLSDDEAAKVLRMLPSRLKRLAKAGQVPHILLPDGELRFEFTELAEWIARHRVADKETAAR